MVSISVSAAGWCARQLKDFDGSMNSKIIEAAAVVSSVGSRQKNNNDIDVSESYLVHWLAETTRSWLYCKGVRELYAAGCEV